MPPHSHRFDAIGTGWQIDSVHPLPPELVERIRARTELFDRTWSRFRNDSLVHRMSREPGSWELPDDAPALFDLYRVLYETTRGAVNPLVGRALEQLGYDAAYSLRVGEVSPVPRFEDAVAWDGRTLTTVRPIVLDIGAAGKGYLVDLVGDVLEEAGIRSFTIDASGDILHRTGSAERALRVALEDPRDSSRAIGVAALGSGALCASASNRRSWPGAHHILDALTGRPVQRVIATWAVASSALIADGLATALFVAEPAALEEKFDFHWVRMLRNGSVQASTRFDGELFRRASPDIIELETAS